MWKRTSDGRSASLLALSILRMNRRWLRPKRTNFVDSLMLRKGAMIPAAITQNSFKYRWQNTFIFCSLYTILWLVYLIKDIFCNLLSDNLLNIDNHINIVILGTGKGSSSADPSWQCMFFFSFPRESFPSVLFFLTLSSAHFFSFLTFLFVFFITKAWRSTKWLLVDYFLRRFIILKALFNSNDISAKIVNFIWHFNFPFLQLCYFIIALGYEELKDSFQ